MIHGRFYFKQTANGNLLGEYSNQISTQNTAESSNLLGNFTDPFIGEYQSVWFELGNRAPDAMQLTIEHKPGTFGRIYKVEWSDANRIVFIGEAFLVDDLLIGNYWDMEVDRLLHQPQ